uniref:LDL receptor related protein 1B n=1 Tax=Pundamilia nyererei TaxID=303518 RepID=A0A3B4FCW0_9CICH
MALLSPALLPSPHAASLLSPSPPLCSHHPDILCDVGEFHCHNHDTCVPKDWLCDGEPDCPDESDETDHPSSKACPLNHMQCTGTKKCIHFNKLCNGARDCDDGYDEGVHCRELLSACHELRCRYGCVMTRNGTFCFCADGFEVGEDGTSCRDHDECAMYGACSQTCTNTYGSYRCSCTEGYILQPNRISCKAKQDPGDSRPALLIGGSDRIVVTHLNGSGLQPLRSLRTNGTLALDFQQNQESVCWVLSSESSGQLRCAVTRSLRGFTREQEIRTQQSLHVQNKHTLHGPAVPAGEPIISNPVSPWNSKAPVFVTSQSSFFHVYPSCFWLFGSRNNRLRSRQTVTTDLVRPRQNEPLT